MPASRDCPAWRAEFDAPHQPIPYQPSTRIFIVTCAIGFGAGWFLGFLSKVLS